MKTLIDKDLVYERGRPLRRYYLTDEGMEVAKRINTVQEAVDQSEETNMRSLTTFQRALSPITNFECLESGHDPDTLEPQLPQINHDIFEESEQTKIPNKACSGRRLGGSMTDKYGTFSSPKERDLPPKLDPTLHEKFIELLSSPEIQPSQKVVKALPAQRLAGKISTTGLKERLNTVGPELQPQETRAGSKTAISMGVQAINLQPGTFTVQLVLDNREVRTKTDRDYMYDELTKMGVSTLVRPLELGDFFWIAKCNDPGLLASYGEEGDEIALDWIVERKRLDDLVESIKDGRFDEQKFRLRRSGVQNVVYIIEEYSMSAERVSNYNEAIDSAIASTQVVDGYFIKRTLKLDDTMCYLARMTGMLKTMYEVCYSFPLLFDRISLICEWYRPNLFT